MPRSFQKPQDNVSDPYLVPVCDRSMRKGGVRFAAKNDLRASPPRKLDMSADEIGVKVCFDYILDGQSLGGGLVQVLLDVTLRVDDCRFTVRADKISRVRQTPEVKLFEIHSFRSIIAI